MFLNPFSEIVEEDRRHPFARMLRTTLLQKLKDSFYVFSGGPLLTNKLSKLHVGLFDYLTLFTFAGLHALFVLNLQLMIEKKIQDRVIGGILFIPLLLINLPLLVVRYTVSAVLAIIVSPITAVISLITNRIASRDIELAKQLTGEDEDGIVVKIYDEPSLSSDESGFKRGVRHPHNLNPNTTDIRSKKKNLAEYSPTDSHLYLFFAKPNPDGDDDPIHPSIARIPYKFDKRTQASFLKAHYTLNIGNISTNEQEEVIERENNSLLFDYVYRNFI